MENKEKYSQHYVYLHRTLGGGTPFYIGIGTKQYGDHPNPKMKYARAYSASGRTNFWRRIVSKYSYTVEILVESTDYDYIKQQEIFFISKFGRRDLKKGTLCNLTEGGDGTVGKIFSEEELENMSKAQKERFSNPSETDAENFRQLYLRTSERMIGNTYAKGRSLTKQQKDNLYKHRIDKLSRRVIQEDLNGNFIKEWHVTREAADYYGITYKAIWKACNLYYKGATSKGFRWRFKE
jgi:hypothetical protein